MQTTHHWRPGRIAIIGCGTIGISWSAYFASRGLVVVAFDPNPARREAFLPAVSEILRTLPGEPAHLPVVCDDQGEAVADADLIVENAAERVDVKQTLIKTLQDLAPARALIVSSTSSLTHSDISSAAAHPERVFTAHPFNPPHRIPLVELYGTDADAVERLRGFYQGIGKQPIVLKREMVGHVANRLTAALWREALYLVQEGVASVEDIDLAVTAGPGLRWAIQGPFMTYHLGGGPGGIRHYLEHLGPSQQYRWASLGQPDVTPELTEQVVAGVEAACAGRSVAELADQRDQLLEAINAVFDRAGRDAD
ncbi:3-hydroxyacyl-CoA dehydrogenase NAD-binding domain-containing protein [Marinobacter sp. C2H3]|uniref:3-hydroxyacyl-CoA dehydrogenase NAD-binding domain-containing protein n=1 Tax=Marinobacter sp. C2H3 TaxID=3119003 RepID=UPI00300E8CD9